MKKMIMAVAIVCVAAFARASSVNWGMSAGTSLDAQKFATGSAYLICVDALAKPTAFADDAAALAWYKDNGATLGDKALFSASVADGFVSELTSHDVAVGRKNYYLVVVNSDASAMAISTSTKALNITTSQMQIAATWNATSQMASNSLSVPEPTSGLLLLLGMAGLALKRKRA